MEFIRSAFQEMQVLLSQFATEENFNKIDSVSKLMADAVRNGGKIIACGNGGSMSDAMHFAEELTGRFREDRAPIPAIAISDPSYLSCVANDYGYEAVFSRFVQAIGQKGDVLLAISTSGNSANVLNAVEVAKTRGMQVIALTGKTGGKLAEQAHWEIRVPGNSYADRIQEIHIKIIHLLIQGIEENLR